MTDGYKGYVFDLDGTLYDTSLLDQANERALQQAIAEWRNISLNDAEALLEEHLQRKSAGDNRSSLYKATLSTGVPDSVIAKWQKRELHPEEQLEPDMELARLLATLARRAQLALITNTRTSIAVRAVSALGIDPAVFAVLRGGDKLKEPKPSPRDLQEIIQFFAIKPAECLCVGDRWDVDLQPAQNIGMAVQLVAGRDELCTKLIEWLAHI